jgi:hypothetical protein
MNEWTIMHYLWANKTSLTLPFFTEVPEQQEKNNIEESLSQELSTVQEKLGKYQIK